jgi:hypothetical protein
MSLAQEQRRCDDVRHRAAGDAERYVAQPAIDVTQSQAARGAGLAHGCDEVIADRLAGLLPAPRQRIADDARIIGEDLDALLIGHRRIPDLHQHARADIRMC